MDQEKINKQFIERLEKLEKVVFIKAVVKDKKSDPKEDGIKSLPDLILELKERGFFKQSKTVKEVYEKIKNIYPCDLNRVAVALVRLHKSRKIRKASKVIGDKKIIAYAH